MMPGETVKEMEDGQVERVHSVSLNVRAYGFCSGKHSAR